MARVSKIGFESDTFIDFIPDTIIAHCVEEAAPILENSMKRVVKAVIRHPDQSTGELVKSIKARKLKKVQDGASVFVGPSGNSKKYYYKHRKGRVSRKYEMSNAAKLVFMEYGTSRQPATPVMAKCVNDARDAVYEKMQEVFNREVGLS